ncbi:hypothetical protein [Ruegeria arenilitoris]|uniref:hypothetical protein n=1 Tax=Ruegeria arenilitoris TaxID=1173585 RepID=UPI001479D829|nr:hypothetical protein [Ruegeria arenilitoris]
MDHDETWLSTEIPGLFARIATLNADPDGLLEAFDQQPGRNMTDPGATPAHVPNWTTWAEVTKTCQRVAVGFPELAADGGVTDPATVKAYRQAAEMLVPDLVDAVMSVGELQISVDRSDLLFTARPVSLRAHLANEMLFALRDGWKFAQCAQCGAWHRYRRTRDVYMCSTRCRVAAHRERHASEESK